MNNHGQSILAEHTMVFFVAIAALVAMTAYVQREFQARIHDTRNFVLSQVMNNNSVCDANCVAAAGGNIYYEYEPYYEQVSSGVQSASTTATGASPSLVNYALGGRYYKGIDEQTNITATSGQAPPECADGANPKPSYC